MALARNRYIPKENGNLNTVLEQLRVIIYSDCVRNDIELKMQLENDLPDFPFNEKEIKQLVLNLTRNAIDAMLPKGVLTISTKYSSAVICFEVSDNGCGIPPDIVNSIFEPFITTKGNGTGLGLTICKSIVEGLHGKIEVNSIVEKGTTFKITIPC